LSLALLCFAVIISVYVATISTDRLVMFRLIEVLDCRVVNLQLALLMLTTITMVVAPETLSVTRPASVMLKLPTSEEGSYTAIFR